MANREGARGRPRVNHAALLLLVNLALVTSAFGQKLSPLAAPPDWSLLDRYQETMTAAEFTALLENVYAPGDAARDLITILPDRAVIRRTLVPDETIDVLFSDVPHPARAPVRNGTPWQPLRGLVIALDPGHLGGRWAQMEERWFRIGESQPVMEGEMTLLVAQHLNDRLRELGAQVLLVRSENNPVTTARPQTFSDKARADLIASGAPVREDYSGPTDPGKENSVRWQAEKLFYRVSEIRTRADLINDRLHPDLVLCLHFNAEEWGDPQNPELVEANHLHLLTNGNYSASELAFDDIRLEMLLKLLGRTAQPEREIGESVADHLAAATGLPPYIYGTPNARRISSNPYVWTRNLLANRMDRCPVIYIEPYVMNSRDTFAREQAGDYEGEREVAGRKCRSLYREYADAVADGLAAYYRRR